MTSRAIVWKTIGAVLAAGAVALCTSGNAAAVPDESDPTNPAVRDYLQTMNALIERVNSDAVAGQVDAGLVTDQIDVATTRLREALLAVDPMR